MSPSELWEFLSDVGALMLLLCVIGFIVANKWRYRVLYVFLWFIFLGFAMINVPDHAWFSVFDNYALVYFFILIIGLVVKAAIKKFKSTAD